MKRFALSLAFYFLLLPAFSAEWPTRPITFLYPYKPGGGGEGMVRVVAAKLSTILGQQVVVDNRGGAGGLIGATAIANSNPDGYSFLISGLGSTVIAPAMSRKPPFDAQKDFTHVALLGGPPPVLAVNHSFPAKTFAEFVQVASGKVEGVPFASPGLGSHGHLIGEMFSARLKLKMLHIPYSGGGPATVDLMSGQVPAAFMTVGSVSQQVRNGKVRILAIASPKRLPAYPTVPTFQELGYPDLTGASWFGISGPAKLPRNITVKLNRAVRQALNDPVVRETLGREGIEAADLDADRFAEFFRDETARWAPIARKVSKPDSAAAKTR